ncbi:MAG: AbrB/MazE/SpoVT family DNA-binding domain-containing protein [Candidatus Carbobacillus altaicus]|nr:AbrB/MazE/SpoVT family DNA-binding domain-containing protein [Candidatus Carbobacillus altaicus]
MVRRVDELGRVVIPIELRRTLGIGERDALEIFVENDTIVLKKHEEACVFCGAHEPLVDYQDKKVCHACLKSLEVIARTLHLSEKPDE